MTLQEAEKAMVEGAVVSVINSGHQYRIAWLVPPGSITSFSGSRPISNPHWLALMEVPVGPSYTYLTYPKDIGQLVPSDRSRSL